MKPISRLAVLLMMFSIASVFVVPLTAQESTPNPDAVEGAALYEAGDFEAALTPLRSAAFADPYDTETLRRYLVSLLYAGQYADIEYPSNLLYLQDPTAFTELAAEAEQRAQAAPDDVRAAIVAAFFAVENGDSAQEKAIDRVFALEPNNAFGFDLLAYSDFYSEDDEVGREPAEKALELASDDPQIIVDLALPFAWALNDPDRAVELLTQAIMLDPTLAEAYADRANVYTDYLDDAEAALPDINRAIELAPDNFMYRNVRGFTYQAAGEHALAYDDFAHVLSVFPPSPAALFGLVGAAIESQRSVAPLLDNRDLVEADAVLTVDTPYTGEMVANRIIRLPIEGEPGEYTITVRAADPMTLDPLLFITKGENIPLALNDDIDGAGAQEDGAYNSQITGTAESGETYVAYILHAGAGSEGEFTVTLEEAAS